MRACVIRTLCSLTPGRPYLAAMLEANSGSFNSASTWLNNLRPLIEIEITYEKQIKVNNCKTQ